MIYVWPSFGWDENVMLVGRKIDEMFMAMNFFYNSNLINFGLIPPPEQYMPGQIAGELRLSLYYKFDMNENASNFFAKAEFDINDDASDGRADLIIIAVYLGVRGMTQKASNEFQQNTRALLNRNSEQIFRETGTRVTFYVISTEKNETRMELVYPSVNMILADSLDEGGNVQLKELAKYQRSGVSSKALKDLLDWLDKFNTKGLTK